MKHRHSSSRAVVKPAAGQKMIYRKPDGGLEKQYRDEGGRAVWERSSMANLFTRVSIRKFQDKKIEKKDLEYILRAAMAAPSAGNQQPWEFYVTDDKMLLQELSKTSPYAGGRSNFKTAGRPKCVWHFCTGISGRRKEAGRPVRQCKGTFCIKNRQIKLSERKDSYE